MMFDPLRLAASRPITFQKPFGVHTNRLGIRVADHSKSAYTVQLISITVTDSLICAITSATVLVYSLTSVRHQCGISPASARHQPGISLVSAPIS